MKNNTAIAAIAIGISMVISSSFIASAIKSYGKSLEKAASYSRSPSIHIPSSIDIDFGGGNRPVRIDVTEKWST